MRMGAGAYAHSAGGLPWMQGVDQVPDAVSAENNPTGERNANGRRCVRARARPAPAPRRHHGGDADAEENAPVGQVEKQQEEDEDALRGGADTERDLRRRRVLAHRQQPESIRGSQRKGGAEEGGDKRHRLAPPYSRTVSIWRSSCAGGV